jgi:hypothetical protein
VVGLHQCLAEGQALVHIGLHLRGRGSHRRSRSRLPALRIIPHFEF